MVNTYIIDVKIRTERNKRIATFKWGHLVIGEHLVDEDTVVVGVNLAWHSLIRSNVSFKHLPEIGNVLETYAHGVRKCVDSKKFTWRFLPVHEFTGTLWGLTTLDKNKFRIRGFRYRNLHSMYPITIEHIDNTLSFYHGDVRIGKVDCFLSTLTAKQKERLWFEMLRTTEVSNGEVPFELATEISKYKSVLETELENQEHTWSLLYSPNANCFMFAHDKKFERV